MFIILVGPAGRCRKGSAMFYSKDFLAKLGIKIASEAITREALIKELHEAQQNDVSEVGHLSQHSSLTIFSEELTVFLGYQNRTLLADMCNWWDCGDRWKYTTKTQGQNDIINIWVNLLGATTPELMQMTLPQEAIGGGFTSRTIFVYEERKGKTVIFPFQSEQEVKLQDNLHRDLEQINLLNGEFKFDRSFLDLWAEWYPHNEEHFQQKFPDPRLTNYGSRRATHILKLSMVLNASRTDSMVITGEDFTRALSILGPTEQKMIGVFEGFGKNPMAQTIAEVAATISHAGTIYFSELLSRFSHDADSDTLKKIVMTLQDMNHVRFHAGKDPRIEWIGTEKGEDIG